MSNVNTANEIEGIAIVGMAGRFPGAKTVDAFWQNLRSGVESITFFTDEELIAAGIDSSVVRDPNYVKAAALLNDVDQFDASFFGFNPREAANMDPQQRIFLECAWEALENAGYDCQRCDDRIGVYAGVGWNNYLVFNIAPDRKYLESAAGYQTVIGNEKDFLTTRVSYHLNLKGPSLDIQTACSTSLVATSLACQSLLNYQCDMALAGGISIHALQKAGYFYQEGGILSADGHCRAFDTQAQGTVPGSGVGIVVLKRLEDALADGDFIHAVIKGSAINNDGAMKVGYTAPSVEGQAEVIAEALALAGIEAESISYIEAHGTGTALGDPIELAALTKVFRESTNQKGFCAIGSVKTNIGHLDAAAGVTSLIKTVLALKHKQIPPSLHFEQPNPQIDFANSPFYVNTTLTDWQSTHTSRRAGVSSLGIGGTNAHVILEEAPAIVPSGVSRPYQLLLLSAKTASALETATINLKNHLRQHLAINLADVAYTLQVGRKDFEHRCMVVVRDREDAIQTLESLDSQRVLTNQETGERPIAFMFPGQGSQYVNMGRELYETEATFREQVDRCCELLKPHLGLDLRSILYPDTVTDEITQQLRQTAIAQPAIFVIEYALAQLWLQWGIRPQALIGHSIGEYVAACLAGVFSLEVALLLVSARAQLMQQLPTGAMLAVPLSEQDIQPFLGNDLSLAAINGVAQCVVAGTQEAIETLQHQLSNQGIECRLLHTSHAFHSQMMEAIVEPFIQRVKTIRLQPPQIPYISNVTGTWITATQATDPAYWGKHLRQTVRFADGIQQLWQDPQQILLEVGAGRTLSTFAQHHPAKTTGQTVLTSLRHPQEQRSDVALMVQTLGQLWLNGISADWSGFYAHERRYRLPLPTYPFERQRYWIEPQARSPLSTTSNLWKDLIDAAQQEADQGISALDELTYQANQAALDRLCLAYINQALRQLGAFSDPNKSYSLEDVLTECQIAPHYRQLLERWLEILVEQGHLQHDRNSFKTLLPLSTNFVETQLAEVRSRSADTPQAIDLLQTCGEHLAAVLTGTQEPLELHVATLAKSGEIDRQNSSLDAYYTKILQATLQQVVNQLPANVNLRILEIGGGTGMATAELLPLLPTQQTHYTFTDVGGLFLSEAQRKFKTYPFVEYRTLNIEQSPTEQGFDRHSVDVIVAVNVLHVTQNIHQTIDNVRSLLAPGGLLLLWEMTQPQLVFDITDGLLMNPLDDQPRSQGNPFLSQPLWQEALRSSGFVEVVSFPETNTFGHHILVAQADAKVDSQIPKAFTDWIKKDASNLAQPDRIGKKLDVVDWFYLPSWKRSLLPSLVQSIPSKCWLVFVDELSLGEKLVQRLKSVGQEVVTVRAGTQFFSHRTSEGQFDSSYTIAPHHPENYRTLLNDLRTIGRLPNAIVHLWSVTPDESAELTLESLEPTETLSFLSLLYLAQALGEQPSTNSVDISIVSNQMQDITGLEELNPAKALALGPSKVIAQEYPHLTCRSIDVVLPAHNQDDKLINQLFAELITPSADSTIAYRGSHRWVKTFESIRCDNAQTSRLRDRGIYLITGGLGGLGLALAEYLAQTVQAKLVLVGRSPMPEREEWEQWLATHDRQDETSLKIQKIQALEALGAEVLPFSADVTNLEQMQVVLQRSYQQFGQLHGVIHAAGVTPGGMMQAKTAEAAAKIFAPKVKGTLILANLLKDMPLDFLVLCSSLTAILGGLGMVDHCAANAFLDAFAYHQTTQHPDRLTVSINWDSWREVGQAANTDIPATLKQAREENLKHGILPQEGIEAFCRILQSTAPQVLVSTRDFQMQLQQDNALNNVQNLESVKQASSLHPRPALSNAYVAPRDAIEQSVTQIWQESLGIESIGIHDNFFHLGGDSLLAVQIVSRLRDVFSVELSLQTLLSDAPTIAELSKVITNLQSQTNELDVMNELLSEIESLSIEEIQEQLRSTQLSSY